MCVVPEQAHMGMKTRTHFMFDLCMFGCGCRCRRVHVCNICNTHTHASTRPHPNYASCGCLRICMYVYTYVCFVCVCVYVRYAYNIYMLSACACGVCERFRNINSLEGTIHGYIEYIPALSLFLSHYICLMCICKTQYRCSCRLCVVGCQNSHLLRILAAYTPLTRIYTCTRIYAFTSIRMYIYTHVSISICLCSMQG